MPPSFLLSTHVVPSAALAGAALADGQELFAASGTKLSGARPLPRIQGGACGA